MDMSKVKRIKRARRHRRVRKRVSGSAARPRLCVFRSLQHIYAQIIDDDTGATLASASSVKECKGGYGGNRAAAEKVGAALADAAKAKNIEAVIFDRGGYKYHGRIAALADAARKGGLKF